LQYKIGQSEGEIERLDSKHTKLDEEIEGASKEIVSTEEQMQEALDTRNEESADFKKALKDDSDAVALLAQAVDSLTAFYNNNKIPLALVAGRATAHGPEDVAPEANFGGPAKSESQGIIAILKMLKEDLSNEMPESKKAETQAAADFARTRSAALASLNAQKKKRTDLETQQADLSETINGHEKDISAKAANYVSKEEELKALAPNCEWLKGAFDKRREARKQEIDGLIQGNATLSGAGDVS
jgi:chromosome segregation ATPase